MVNMREESQGTLLRVVGEESPSENAVSVEWQLWKICIFIILQEREENSV